VLGVEASRVFRSWGKPRAIAGTASEIAKALGASEWQRLSAGQGTKRPRLHDWCYLELADLEAGDFDEKNHGLWTRGLLIRRNIADGDLAYFTTWCPAGTPIDTLVSVEGRVGRSRTASKPPRTSSVSITTRPGLGMAGIGMSRWSWSRGGLPTGRS
jgi:SRSO17 transposase